MAEPRPKLSERIGLNEQQTDEETFSPEDEEFQYITKAIALFCASTRLSGRRVSNHRLSGQEDSEVLADETISMAMMFERYLTGEVE